MASGTVTATQLRRSRIRHRDIPEVSQSLGSAFETILTDRPAHAPCLLQPNLPFGLTDRPHGIRLNRRTDHLGSRHLSIAHRASVCLVLGIAGVCQGVGSPRPPGGGRHPPGSDRGRENPPTPPWARKNLRPIVQPTTSP